MPGALFDTNVWGLLALPQVCEREEPPGVVALWHQMAAGDSASPKVWMDAYLAAFAMRGGLRLVTGKHLPGRRGPARLHRDFGRNPRMLRTSLHQFMTDSATEGAHIQLEIA